MPHPAVFGSKHFTRQLAARRPLRSTIAGLTLAGKQRLLTAGYIHNLARPPN
jgi:hypothetical protein